MWFRRREYIHRLEPEGSRSSSSTSFVTSPCRKLYLSAPLSWITLRRGDRSSTTLVSSSAQGAEAVQKGEYRRPSRAGLSNPSASLVPAAAMPSPWKGVRPSSRRARQPDESNLLNSIAGAFHRHSETTILSLSLGLLAESLSWPGIHFFDLLHQSNLRPAPVATSRWPPCSQARS